LTPFEDVDGWKKRFNEIWRRLLLQEIRANRGPSCSLRARLRPHSMAIPPAGLRKEKAAEISAHQIGSGLPLYAMDFCV
jgi:hypothetical protein